MFFSDSVEDHLQLITKKINLMIYPTSSLYIIKKAICTWDNLFEPIICKSENNSWLSHLLLGSFEIDVLFFALYIPHIEIDSSYYDVNIASASNYPNFTLT